MNTYRGEEYWNMVRISNEDKEYPSNMGVKWTNEEELLLLEQLNNNENVEIIALKHKRTVGGINARLRDIAYKMFLNKKSFEEIIKKTKLDLDSIKQTIEKKQKTEKRPNNANKIKTKETKVIDNILISINKNDYIQLENDVYEMKNDIHEMKNDINEIKNTLGELVVMIKAIYEFEDA